MYNQMTPLQKLKWAYELLTHPISDKDEIYRRVRIALSDVKYQRMPFKLRFEGVIRASNYKSDDLFYNLDRMSCAPPAVAALNRCNWQGEPAFYCSNENGVPLMEVRPELNTYVAISHWRSKFTSMIEFYGLPIGVETLVNTLPETSEFRQLLLKDSYFQPDFPSEIKEVDKFIGDIFKVELSAQDNLYWFTSGVAKCLFSLGLDSEEKLEGLIYPSVAGQFSGHNLVLTENFAKNNLKLVGSAMYRVESIDTTSGEYVLAPHKGLKGINSDGTLIWNDVHPDDAHERFRISSNTPVTPFDANTKTLRY